MRRKESLLLLAILIVSIFLYNNVFQGKVIEKEKTIVTNVVDGDTIVISGGERVRLSGIDTPEKGEFF